MPQSLCSLAPTAACGVKNAHILPLLLVNLLAEKKRIQQGSGETARGRESKRQTHTLRGKNTNKNHLDLLGNSV